MTGLTTALTFGLVFTSNFSAEAGNQSNDSSWASRIARGLYPYRKLTTGDFQVNDSVRRDGLIYTGAFISYRYQSKAFPVSNGSRARAAVSTFDVKSGFDVRNSWRRSRLTDPARYLEHEQGHLIINELAAKQLSSFLSQKTLQVEGATPQEALLLLDKKVKLGYEAVARRNEQEQERYDRETRGGDDPVAQARWWSALNSSLRAIKD